MQATWRSISADVIEVRVKRDSALVFARAAPIVHFVQMPRPLPDGMITELVDAAESIDALRESISRAEAAFERS